MARRPDNVTDCPGCGKCVGVQREYNLHPSDHAVAWRIAKHGSPTCPNSRVTIPASSVRRNRLMVVSHG